MDSEIYSENLIDHYENPRNFGVLNNPTNKAADANIHFILPVFQAFHNKYKVKVNSAAKGAMDISIWL